MRISFCSRVLILLLVVIFAGNTQLTVTQPKEFEGCNKTYQRMQKTNNRGHKDDDIDDRGLLPSPSAFQVVGNEVKSRPSSAKRDSGYATDNSPGNFESQLLFTFDDIDENSKVEDGDNDDDDAKELSDQEVEMVLSQSPEEGAVAIPGSLHIPPRPQAPPPRVENLDLLNEVYDEGNDDDVFEPVAATKHSTSYSVERIRRRGQCYFRPITIRAIGTQTPNPHSHIMQEALDRFHPYPSPISRANACLRNRHFSEGEDLPSTSSPLPDIIPPTHRDRSVSLPDVPFLRQQQEQEVGRELRRISDEFHHFYASGHQRRNTETIAPGSFPGTSRFRFTDLWHSLREVFASSSPIVHRNSDSDSDHDVDRKHGF